MPGDVVRVRSGDFVPADFKILDAEATVDQSAITGESLPVDKKTGDLVYSGSLVKKGEVTAVVTATGAHTMFGKTAQLVQLAKPKLHMEGVISNLVKWLIVMVVSLLLVAAAVSWVRGINLLRRFVFGAGSACGRHSCCFAHDVHDYDGAWLLRTCKKRRAGYSA